MRSLFGPYINRNPATTADDSAHEALDTLASLLKSAGQHAFDLESEDSDGFHQACDAWARHVLTGTALPGDVDTRPSNSERRWAELRHFYRDRRRREQEFVHRNLNGFKGMIWELVGSLKTIHETHREHSDSLTIGLEQLEAAAASSSLEEVREAIHTAVGEIQSAITQQQCHFHTQMEAMGSRLAHMRSDLLDTRRRMALDPLTHVFNRGAFDDALKRYVDLSLLSGQPTALMMIDLDHFKAVNDTHGHPMGDKVLREVADCIVRTFPRKNDFIARYGGEEFVAILYGAGYDDVVRLARVLLSNIRKIEITLPDDKILRTTCSIGCTLVQGGDAPDTLLERADRALYQAKNSGRDRICMDAAR